MMIKNLARQASPTMMMQLILAKGKLRTRLELNHPRMMKLRS